MNQVIARLGDHPLTLGTALIAAGAAVFLIFLALVVAWRRAAHRGRGDRSIEMEFRLAELARIQAEMTGRLQSMASGLSDRLDGLGHRIGQSMTETTRTTESSLGKLAERLAVIDSAQKNITELSSEVVQLQKILANKQTRGAFGQARMEAIVADGLPPGAYDFQATLTNRMRPDCLVRMPNGAPGLVVDAKFPLEAWNAIRAADGPEALKLATAQFRRDTQHHIKAIAEKYFIAGETQDTAFMFVPSESIFADIHEHYEDVVQFAHRNRVVIVSPALLMLSIQVVQALLKDARMREQAHVIRDQVVALMQDVARLDERVRALSTHFGQTAKDIDQILVSTRKITARGEKIEALDLDEPAERRRPPVERTDLLTG